MLTEAQKSLVEDNHDLIYSFLGKKNLSKDNFYDLAAIALCKAAMDYQEDKSRFSTLAYIYMEREINNYYRKQNSYKRVKEKQLLHLDFQLFPLQHNYETSSNCPTENEALLKISIQEFKNHSNKTESQIIKMLNQGYKQPEISSVLNCTQNRITRLKSKMMNYCFA